MTAWPALSLRALLVVNQAGVAEPNKGTPMDQRTEGAWMNEPTEQRVKRSGMPPLMRATLRLLVIFGVIFGAKLAIHEVMKDGLRKSIMRNMEEAKASEANAASR